MQDSSRHELAMGVPVDRPAGFRRWFRPLAMAVVAIACSALPSGTSLLLHAAGMAAQETDTDGDTMPDAWEDVLRARIRTTRATPPAIPTTTAGRTRRSSPPRRHPLGHHVRYFAEGSTGYFDTSVAVLNLSTTDTAHVALALLSESGGVVSHRFTLAPAPAADRCRSTRCSARPAPWPSSWNRTSPVAADRFMTWGTSGIGASLDSGALGAGDDVVLRGRRDRPVPPLLPAAESRDDAGHRHGALPGRRRIAGHHGRARSRRRAARRSSSTRTTRRWPRASLGAIVTSDVPIFAERAMYLDGGGTLGGGVGVGGIAAALDAVVLRRRRDRARSSRPSSRC